MPARSSSREEGYVLLTLLLVVALMAIAAYCDRYPDKFEIQRDQEEEMIHRGVQYSRAIRAYYKKFGRYPTKLEDLDNTNNLRYLRKHYKDPLNKNQDFKLLHYGEPGVTLGGGSALVAEAFRAQARSVRLSGARRAAVRHSAVVRRFGWQFRLRGVGSGFGNSGSGSSGVNSSGVFAQSSGSGGNSNGGFGANSNSQTGSGQQGPGNRVEFSSRIGSHSGFSQGKAQGRTIQLRRLSNLSAADPIVGVASISKKTTIREFNHKKKYNEWQFIYDPQPTAAG